MSIQGKFHLLVAVEDFRVVVLFFRFIGKPEKERHGFSKILETVGF